ncbi:hypothetical protein RQN9TF_07565 [Rhodococcus qingshengii]|jgi:hypothetical protein|nr:hypothetical protein G418_22359 [Rhodococcus qingshengii BKS 20-40]MBP2521491.1 hypothetical protein [Rhodococcus sp. PvP104]BDQ19049.1 hypothetical protein RQN9TF_07565 [Rhodococcus qingshengii]SCC65943.1 hypothetical protein GA0061093_12017 [Rhodococcus qingshengii]
MFDLSMSYLSDLVGFGSIDLVGTFAKYLNTLSAYTPTPL